MRGGETEREDTKINGLRVKGRGTFGSGRMDLIMAGAVENSRMRRAAWAFGSFAAFSLLDNCRIVGSAQTHLPHLCQDAEKVERDERERERGEGRERAT